MTTLTIALSGGDRQPLELIGKMANRHGLIAGATGTGKTITLRNAQNGGKFQQYRRACVSG